jgi:hypothetical protein
MYNKDWYEIYRWDFKNWNFGDLTTRIRLFLFKIMFWK